ALIESARVRSDEPDVAQRDALRSEERVSDRKHRLGDDRERILVQQVMSLGDRSGKRALDRQYPLCADRARDGFGDTSKAAHRDALVGWKHGCSGSIRVRALGAW